MEKTEGQKRVRVDFNPNALKKVTEFKNIMSSAIDCLCDLEREVKDNQRMLVMGEDPNLFGDFMREISTAKTDIQKASMMGVAAITHDLVFSRGLHKKGDE